MKKNIVIYFISAVIFIFTFFPFYWIIATSFKTPIDIYKVPPAIIPGSITFENYITAFTKNHIDVFMVNSLIVSVPSVFLSTLISVFGAYAASRLAFKGKKVFKAGLVSTQFFPMIVILIPLFMLCRILKLYNSYMALILPYIATQVPISILLLSNYFADIPREMEEAARIDGCSRMQTLMKVILPLAVPGIAATSIYSFVQVWQEYLIASSFISNQSKFTLTVGLSTFQGQHATDWGGLMATAVVIALPALFLFTSAQQYFINNLAGGVKE